MIRVRVPEWVAVGRLEEQSPVSVPPAAVSFGFGSCGVAVAGVHHEQWFCTRREGHTGRHAAAITGGEVMAVWP